MSKIERFDGNLEAFGSAAIGTERTLFGETTQADDLTSQINADYKRGWGIVGVNDAPTKQDFNALGFTATQLAAYLHQVGVPEWNGAQEYHVNSFVNRVGVIYKCKTNNLTSPTAPESDTTNWEQVTSATSDLIAAQFGRIRLAGGLVLQWQRCASPAVNTTTVYTRFLSLNSILNEQMTSVGGNAFPISTNGSNTTQIGIRAEQNAPSSVDVLTIGT